MWLWYRLLGPLYRRLARRRPAWSGQPCPWCGYGDFDPGEAPYFRLTRSGRTPGTPDGPAAYWCEGVQTCPRCRYEWEYGDSS